VEAPGQLPSSPPCRTRPTAMYSVGRMIRICNSTTPHRNRFDNIKTTSLFDISANVVVIWNEMKPETMYRVNDAALQHVVRGDYTCNETIDVGDADKSIVTLIALLLSLVEHCLCSPQLAN